MFFKKKHKKQKHNNSRALVATQPTTPHPQSTRHTTVANSVAVVRKPFYPGVPRQTGFTIAVPDNLWAFAQNALTASHPNECAGFGEITDGNLTWLWWDTAAQASSALVKSSQGEAMVAALTAGRTINLQWHTHPSFGTSWSVTDTDDQQDLMDSIIKNEAAGSFTFLVFNFKNWNLRRIHWENHKVSLIEDGYATNSMGTRLDINDAWYKPKGNKVGETSVFDPYADDYWGLYGDYGQEENHWWDNHNSAMMGKWSKKAEDYRPLFEAAGVTFGFWYLLRQKLEAEHGKGIYDLVINDPELWEFVYDEKIQ